jgi:uncharacterized protein (DUF58 family)
MQVGDELEEAFTLINDGWLPALWAEVRDGSNMPHYSPNIVRTADINTPVEWRTNAICTQRGVFTLGNWELLTGDPFGFFSVRHHYAHAQEIVVYPPLAPLPAHALPRLSTIGEQRTLRQPLLANTNNAHSARPYQPGDAFHHIHWRTTARRQALFTKQFEPEAASTIWLVPEFKQTTLDDAVAITTASLAAQLMQRRLAVGLLTSNNAGDINAIAPKGHTVALWDMLRALAPLHTTVAQLPLAEILLRGRSALSQRSCIIVITAQVESAVASLLWEALPHGVQLESILLAPDSLRDGGWQNATLAAFAQQHLEAHVLYESEIKPLVATYGEVRRWEFKTLGTGRAVAIHTPRNAPSLEAQLAALQGKHV